MPSVTESLTVGDKLRRSVMGAAKTSLGHLPAELHSHEDGGPAQHHLHPFYLAEDANEDGYIDHLVLHAPRGVSIPLRSALATAQPAAGNNKPLAPFHITPDWLGTADSESAPGGLLGPARVWRSATPYVPDLHLKPRFQAVDAMLKELERRGFPRPIEIEWLPAHLTEAGWIAAEEFRVWRDHPTKPTARSGSKGSFWRLFFAVPVWGPIALGFACHLGLGLFRRDQGVTSDAGGGAVEAVTETEPPPRNIVENT